MTGDNFQCIPHNLSKLSVTLIAIVSQHKHSTIFFRS
jgi:hypothetical protein